MFPRMTAAALAAGMAAAVLAAPGQARAETVLKLVYPFPDFLVYTRMCKELAARITERSKGAVRIDVLPFNSIKMFQQPSAVRSGRVDIACTGPNFYARAVPENEAVSTSNVTPAKARANGGHAMIDRLGQKHYNVKYLGWTSSGAGFRIYMRDAPKWTKDGLPDLSGVKLRDNPIYGAFFRALNASTHNLSPAQVYGALEKGVVDASAWATIGLPGLKWDKFLRHAVRPDFYQIAISWIINLDRWNKLEAGARETIQDAVIEEEMTANAVLRGIAEKEKADLQKGGMTFHDVPNGEAYLKIAVDSAYARIVDRLEKAGRDSAHVARLRSLYRE